MGCASGAVKYGLYVDDVPVPGSGRNVNSTETQTGKKYLQLAGLTGSLSAGGHQAKVGFDCLFGDYTGLSRWQDVTFTGILLGG